MTNEVGPVVGPRHIDFSVVDPDHDLESVRLWQDVARPRLGPEFVRFANSDRWSLALPRPEADRIEYQFEIRHRDGSSEVTCDPANPNRAPGPFGDRSVIEFPEYRHPSWLGRDEVGGELTALEIRLRSCERASRL